MPQKKPVPGNMFTTQDLSIGMAIVSVFVVVLACLGFTTFAFVLFALMGVAAILWVMQQQVEADQPGAKFGNLRRLVRMRRQATSDDAKPGDTPGWVWLGIAAIVFCVTTTMLCKAWQQASARSFPAVPGTMTRYERVDVDLGSQLEVEYQYTVDGRIFTGNRKRFLYRPMRVGTEEAIQLCQNWGQGNRIPVFYDPQAPHNAVVDNTFCKGDQLFVWMNINLLVIAIVGGIAAFRSYYLEKPKPAGSSFKNAGGNLVLKLSNWPVVGAVCLMLALMLFAVLTMLLVGGFWIFGSGPIPWILTTIDWMLVIAPAALVTALGICVAERMSWGRRGRYCEIDPMRRLLMIQPAGFGDDQTLEFDRISAIALRSRREDLTRGFCRTFTPTICYSATDGSRREIGLDRHRCRRSAVNQLELLRKVLDAGKPVDTPIDDERELPAAPVTFPAATWSLTDPAASFSD